MENKILNYKTKIAIFVLSCIMLMSTVIALAFGGDNIFAKADDSDPILTGYETLNVSMTKSGAITEFDIKLDNVTQEFGECQLQVSIMYTTEQPGVWDYTTLSTYSSAFGIKHKTSMKDIFLAVNPEETEIPAGTYRIWFRILAGQYPFLEAIIVQNASVVNVANTVSLSSLPPSDPVKAGYNFSGWYYDQLFTEAYDGRPILEDTNFYAKFTPIIYNITYILEGGNLSGEYRTTYTVEDGPVITLPQPVKEGYMFVKWFSSQSFSGAGFSTLNISPETLGDKIVYAKWDMILYTVMFYVDNEVYSEIYVPHGASLGDYAFADIQTLNTAAFFTNENLVSLYSMSEAVYEDTVLYTETAFDIYVSLSYSVNGKITTDLLVYNSSMNNLRTPEAEGYIFEGWFYDEDCTRPVVASDKLKKDITIYAKLTEEPGFWESVGIWFSSVGGILTTCAVGVVILGVTAYVIYKKKRA